MSAPDEEHDDFAGGFGGPGPEDWANGAAALAAALVREAGALADAAASLRAVATPPPPGTPGGEAMTDIRRARAVLAAAGEAATRASLALAAAEVVPMDEAPAQRARRIADAARRVGMRPTVAAPMLRAAALALRMDDAAARVAATTLAEDIASQLGREE